jgi:CubicO group peptidase (beta-lactamase class C family)
MAERKFTQIALAFTLLFSVAFTSIPAAGHAQAPAVAAAPDRYSESLTAIEEKVEARRKELGIPGMSLAIVKDDQVIYSKGLGYKDFENKVPVTADTQFAIGSTTKAFTALSVLMTEDEGKISLDASPRSVLPYFKMSDPDTDKDITIRDLLTHSSGLNRTDLAMVTGKLTRAELIRVAGEAKPIGKLREQFGYQNLMYATAGEVVAVAQKKPWEKFVPERIFEPLGMTNSTMSTKEMEKARDRSFGYNYNFDTKETTKLPYRTIDQVAPAGSINSTANDMAKWLRFVLSGGTANGKRLVSEKNYAEWLKPQMKVNSAGTVHYSLGWFVQKWNGLTVVQHGGNIDGFNALVAMIPEKKLGFVILTNVSNSPLGNELMPIVWASILGKPGTTDGTSAAAVGPEAEAGKYRLNEAGMDIEIKWSDGKLMAFVPGQPTYTLENTSGRRYRLIGAPDGFFITFKDKEMFLEQPQGNFTLPRIGSESKPAGGSDAAKALIGRYEFEKTGRPLEIKEADGKITLNLDGQQPYTLVEKTKDTYSLWPLPDTYSLKVVRGNDGKITTMAVVQPEGEFTFKPTDASKITITVDELMAKAIAAAGGEENWKKITSRVATATIDLEQQGMKATATVWSKAPNKTATETRMFALGKEVATGWEFFDGTSGESNYSFSPVADKYTGRRLEDLRLASDFYSILDWKSKYKSITVARLVKVGGEEAYAVEFQPENGTKFTEYYSTKTFLVLKRDGVIVSSTSSQQTPYSIRFEDYRDVDGVKLPFKQINNTLGNGDIVTVLTSVKHNVAVDDKLFAPKDLN